MSEPILRARGLSKTFRSGPRTLEVLQQLDLEIDAGESVAIVGESGVGKSTLLHLLGGLDRPDRGRLTFRELEVFRAGRVELAAYRSRSVGFVFQFHYLLPELTAIENVEIPFRIARRAREARPRAQEVLTRLGLEERMQHHPAALSGGEQQRVAIARAIVASPEIVFADEPTGNLDPATGARVFASLAELQQERSFALVLVTHNERLAASCGRVLRLEQGRLRPLGSAETRDYFNRLGAR